MKRWLCLFLVVWGNLVLAQSQRQTIDSLRRIIDTSNDDSVRMESYNQLAWVHLQNDPREGVRLAARAYAMATQNKWARGEAQALYIIGACYYMQGNYSGALEKLIQSNRIFERVKDRSGLARGMNLVGGIYAKQQDYEQALKSYQQALDIFLHEVKSPKQQAKLYINIGEAYLKLNRLDEALKMELRALYMADSLKMPADQAFANGLIGQVYERKGDFRQAINHAISAIPKFRAMNHKTGEAEYSLIGARIYRKMGALDKALVLAQQGIALANHADAKHIEQEGNLELAAIYAGMHNYEQAYIAHQRYTSIKDSLFSIENAKTIAALRASHEDVQQQAKIALQASTITALEERRNYGLLVICSLVVGVGAMVVALSNIRKKKRQVELYNRAVLEQKEEIAKQRNAIEEKNLEIEKKNKDIYSSLEYAKRIQRLMMPTEAETLANFADGFILLRPRDVVSGDFYWYTRTDTGEHILAAVDSTGHGVPGALMSMIGLEQLTEIVNVEKIVYPDAILERLHLGVVNILKQDVSHNKDGMDIAVITIKDNHLYFAGAKNGLFYVQQGEGHYIKADRHSIGGRLAREDEEWHGFTMHSIPIDGPISCYLFSDGYQDQFGGRLQKKFSPKRLRELLHSVHHLPMAEQREILNDTLMEWMEQGNERQLDDVLVIGLRIGAPHDATRYD